MIEPMKRYSFFVYQPEYKDFILHLRELGVVHIKERTNPKEVEEFAQNLRVQNDIKQLKLRLNTIVNGNPLPQGETREDIIHAELPSNVLEDYEAYTCTLEELINDIAEHESKIAEARSQQKELAVWGDFDLTLIKKLEVSGYYFHYFIINPNLYQKEWEERYNAQVIQQETRYTYFVTVTKDPTPPELEHADLQKLPRESLSQLIQKEQRLSDEKRLLEGTRNYLAYHPEILDKHLVVLKNSFNLKNAHLQSVQLFDDKLSIVEGWIPEKLAPQMEQNLEGSGVAYAEIPIDDVNEVPVQLRNNRFTRVFEPLVELFSLPNYGELDPTPFIAPFFVLFFGICFGDAGYGLFVLILASILKHKAKERSKPLLELIQWLGFGALVMGFLSGSFFGIELVKVPFLEAIKDYFISSENMMIISIAIGLIQIIFAKYIGAAKKTKQVGLKRALSEYAWPTLIIMLLLLVGLPYLDIIIPAWLTYILYGIVGVSVLLVLFYNNPDNHVLQNFGSGLWTTYNTISGLLGDTLSYIRLFAIGLTGAVLGQVFNQLAGMATKGLPIYVAIPVGAFILIFGHGINFGLTTIGALAHPIRLIFVEYFNNSQFEGGGKAYEPLRKLEVNKD